MKKLIELTADYNQSHTIALENGETFTLQLQYSTLQRGWFFTIIYNDFILRNIRLTAHWNVLLPYVNIIPFGIMVTTADETEPFFLEDFINNRVKIFILTQTEALELEKTL